MSKVLKIAGIVVLAAAILGAGFVGGSVAARALAANTADGLAPGQNGGFGPGGFGAGPRDGNRLTPGGARGGGTGLEIMQAYRDQFKAAIAKSLGLTTDEFDKAVQGGQTPWEIAQSKGMSADQYRAAILQAHSDMLAQAVKDGKLTQDQADAILNQLKRHFDPSFGPGFAPHDQPAIQPQS